MVAASSVLRGSKADTSVTKKTRDKNSIFEKVTLNINLLKTLILVNIYD
jgi:hypothetical protein